jgi:hypothetical protein
MDACVTRQLQEQVRHHGESRDVNDGWHSGSQEQSGQLADQRFLEPASSTIVFMWMNSRGPTSQAVLREHDICGYSNESTCLKVARKRPPCQSTICPATPLKSSSLPHTTFLQVATTFLLISGCVSSGPTHVYEGFEGSEGMQNGPDLLSQTLHVRVQHIYLILSSMTRLCSYRPLTPSHSDNGPASRH